jgi:hypothetical protein
MPLIDEFMDASSSSVNSLKVYSNNTDGIGDHKWVVAAGYKRLAFVRACAGYPQVTSDSYKLYDTTNTSSFNQIGPIYCTEISHSDQADKGWLFAGGYRGLAVLSSPSGNGWDGSAGLSSIDDLKETIGEEVCDFSFKRLSGINGPVYKLYADGTYLYVMTREGLFRIEMAANKFKLTDPTALGAEVIYSAQPQEYLLDIAPFLNQPRGFLATTDQLCWHDDWAEDGMVRGDWSTNVTYTCMPCSLSFKSMHITGTFAGKPVSEQGTIGNLYISSSDSTNRCIDIHRYNVKGTLEGGNQSIAAIEPINHGDVTDGLFKIIPQTLGFNFGGVGAARLWPYLDGNDLLATTRIGEPLRAVADAQWRDLESE